MRGTLDGARAALEQLQTMGGEDPVVTLSLAELLLNGDPDKRTLRRLLKLCTGFSNDSEVHAGIHLMHARALRSLGLVTAARELLGKTLRRRKNRSAELLAELRWERVLCHDAEGNPRLARKDLERIIADNPDHAKAAKRLGLR